jgi:pantoate kinase
MNTKLKSLVQREIRNAIRDQSLAELAQIAERFTKTANLLKDSTSTTTTSTKSATATKAKVATNTSPTT